MPRKIDAETRAAIVAAYLSSDNVTYKDVAEQFGINLNTVRRIVGSEVQAGNGIKPDRRTRVNGKLTDDALDQIHDDVIAAQDPHPRTLDWMDHVKPLHKYKQELELRVQHKQAELEKARQELRDFTATLKQLMEDTI